MSDNHKPTFHIPVTAQQHQTTGRQIVTFRKNTVPEGVYALWNKAGISNIAHYKDFSTAAEMHAAGGILFPRLGVAVVTLDADGLRRLNAAAAEVSAIQTTEPERIFYAIGDSDPLSLSYLKGYRDAINHLYETAAAGKGKGAGKQIAAASDVFADDASSTWGLKATNVVNSPYTGRGVKVAILDTGFDMTHPDFAGRTINAQSFYPDEDVQDRVGHGTHVTGTACGATDINGRRYGIASDADIYVGKVLGGTQGSGPTAGILAGIEWALSNGCQVISMSLSVRVPVSSPAFDEIGDRALQSGTLIIAAAGNYAQEGDTVGQPANSPSIMAVGAVDNQLQLASFSEPSGPDAGANVDLAGPGVDVYSSVPMATRYDVYSGTSMATPHVAGIAALLSGALGATGSQLWQMLVSRALRLPIDTAYVGSGLVQAPTP